MNNSNIDVDIIDETLLYICINGKREHISVDNARIKYAKNKQVLDLIDSVLERYHENSRPLEGKEQEISSKETVAPNDLDALNNAPLEDDIEIDLGELATEQPVKKESLDSLRDKPLTPPSKKDLDKAPLEDKKVETLDDLRHAPLGVVNESKFASIYEKYSVRIRETFPTDSPSFLDVEKLTKDKKTLEEI